MEYENHTTLFSSLLSDGKWENVLTIHSSIVAVSYIFTFSPLNTFYIINILVNTALTNKVSLHCCDDDVTSMTSEMEHRSLWVTEKECEEWRVDGGLAKILLLSIKSCYTAVMMMMTWHLWWWNTGVCEWQRRRNVSSEPVSTPAVMSLCHATPAPGVIRRNYSETAAGQCLTLSYFQDFSHEDEKNITNNCTCKLILYEIMIFQIVTP